LKKISVDLKYKNLDIGEKLDLILMSHRNTPTTKNNKTPSELIFNFIPRTLFNSTFKSSINNKFEDKKHLSETKIGNDIIINDKHCYQDAFFKKGYKIFYKLHFKDIVKWKAAVIKEVISKFIFKILIGNSGELFISTRFEKAVWMTSMQVMKIQQQQQQLQN
jgi:hypothetical protein